MRTRVINLRSPTRASATKAPPKRKVAATGGASPADASATKVFGTEFFVQGYRLLMEVLGPVAAFDRNSPGAVLAGSLARGFQGTLILTFGGGVNEVQRDLVALFGLGLPRVPRH